MPDDESRTENSLAEGWPEEEGNDQLTEFASNLRDALPVLSEMSMARVERSMEGELRQLAFRRRAVIAATIAAMAASIAIAVSILSRPDQQVAVPPVPAKPAPVLFVSDDFELPPAPARNLEAPAQSLISLDKYQSLIGDEQITQREIR